MDDGPFGLHRTALSSFGASEDAAPPALKKTPSEPDLQAAQAAADQATAEAVASAAERLTGAEGHRGGKSDQACLFTCTVSRKATRAMYHLSDPNDVAFLLAKFARELRQATKQVPDDREDT